MMIKCSITITKLYITILLRDNMFILILCKNLLQTSKYVEPVPYKVDLSLHSGILKYLSNLKRYGDAIMNYEDKLLKLNIGFEFKELEVKKFLHFLVSLK